MGRIGWSALGAVAVACCVGLAFAARSEGPVRSAGAAGNTPAAPLPGRVRVTYAGPRGLLSGLVQLRAAARSTAGRIVAVTYLLDGSPLGSATSPPFALDLNAGLLPRGRHALRVIAVDNRGHSATGGTVRVRTRGRSGPLVVASPQRGLGAALAALRSGGATVLLEPGRYELTDIKLGSGAKLIGSGPRTVIAAPPKASYFALLSVRGHGVRISQLALDGGGPGPGEGIAVSVGDGSSDVRIQRLRITHVRGDGVNIWGRHSGVSVQDSQIDGRGTAHAGVQALESAGSDVSVIRTRIHGFRSFGIDFAQRRYGQRAAGLHALALNNDVSAIRDPARLICRSQPRSAGCGTNEAGIESGAVEAAIIGNRITSPAWDGVETVGSSTRTTVVANAISRTRTGIYLEHSTNASVIAGNRVSDVRTGINVEWLFGGVGSKRNTFTSNRVSGARKTGLFVDVGADENTIVANHFVGGARPAIVLQGSSLNVVRENEACGPGGPLVHEQAALFDNGGRADSSRNQIVGNVGHDSCTAP